MTGSAKAISVGSVSQPHSVFLQVCGSPDIPLHLLKSVATYKGIEPSASLIQWFWEVMESFSNTERSLFLRFVWGRTRLPRTIADFRGRDFVIQVGSWSSGLTSSEVMYPFLMIPQQIKKADFVFAEMKMENAQLL